ncbi:MAG: hypothetical protein LLG44_02080 [Chloroflexi bacterium]|nr:hypothetical protein [Chloroflexota bacterium]
MIPTVDFFGTQVSRLIVGDNPVNGHSYIPELISRDDMIDYYTEQNLLAAMAEASSLGYNTWLPLANEFMLRAIRHYRNTGAQLNVIFQSFPAVDFLVNVRQMAECKPLGIYHQGTTTDGLCEQGQYQVIRDRIKMIHDAGIKAGIGTHVPETVLRAEDEDWDVDFYVTCLHNTRTRGAAKESSFITGKPKHLKFYMEDRERMFGTIRKVAKPCIAFKVFAGGQIFYGKTPVQVTAAAEGAIRETFENIKSTDLAAIGCFQRDKDQLRENAEIVWCITATG